MDIRIRYKDGKLDAFDANTFTKSEPFMGTNMLSEFVLQARTPESDGLWLEAHWYDATPSQDADMAASELVARRKRGWKFLLAEASEVEGIESVSVDGTLAMQRILGELVDVMTLKGNAAAWLDDDGLSVAGLIVEVFDALKAQMSMEGADCDEIAAACGCTYGLVCQLQALRQAEAPEEETAEEEIAEADDEESEGYEQAYEEEENWLEGLVDEDVD